MNYEEEQHYAFAYEMFLELDEGQAASSLAETLRVDRSTVSKWRRNGYRSESHPVSPEMLEEARNLLEQNLGYMEVSRRVGISKNALIRHLPGMGKKVHEMTKEDIEFAKYLLEDGANYHEVARTLGFHPNTIRSHIPGYTWTREQVIEFITDVRKAQNPDERRRVTSSQLMRGKAYLQAGDTLEVAASKIGLHKQTLGKYFPEYKLDTKTRSHVANQAWIDQRMPSIEEGLRLMKEEKISAYKAAKVVHVSANTLRKYAAKG